MTRRDAAGSWWLAWVLGAWSAVASVRVLETLGMW